MGTAIEHPVPDRIKPSFVIFDIRALWRPYGNSGRKRVEYMAIGELLWLSTTRWSERKQHDRLVTSCRRCRQSGRVTRDNNDWRRTAARSQRRSQTKLTLAACCGYLYLLPGQTCHVLRQTGMRALYRHARIWRTSYLYKVSLNTRLRLALCVPAL